MKNEIQVNTWEDCKREIQRIENANGKSPGLGLCFRGQSNAEWALETTLERRTNQHYLVIDYLRLISGIKSEIETFTGVE
jgi:hypothetical protein